MRPLIAAALALILAACSTVGRVDAAYDVHRFLVSVRDNDRAAFDRYVDREALKRSLESRLQAEARNADLPRDLQRLAAVLSGPLADAVGDVAIRPSVFRAIAVSLGYSPSDPLPSQLSIAAALRPVDRRHVCAAKSKRDPCLLTFELQGDAWRLVGVDAPLRELKL